MPERTIVWIHPRVVQLAWDRFAAEHGMAGDPDPVLLNAALGLPRSRLVMASRRLGLAELAAEQAAAVLRLRPFPQGNAAMACLLSMVWLQINGVELRAPPLEKFTLFAALASGRLSRAGLAQWIRVRHLAGQPGVQSVVQVRLRGRVVQGIAAIRNPRTVSHQETASP
jgi:prophage maintenance system killer protein